HVDPTWVRIVWAVLIIPGWGLPLLLYVLAALILPERNADEVVYSKDLS
ncbi:MAG: PspC domain-containing protein, partial [Deinococcus sp.]|nr:PspC domain-containing protein [Deinococcus sp.]